MAPRFIIVSTVNPQLSLVFLTALILAVSWHAVHLVSTRFFPSVADETFVEVVVVSVIFVDFVEFGVTDEVVVVSVDFVEFGVIDEAVVEVVVVSVVFVEFGVTDEVVVVSVFGVVVHPIRNRLTTNKIANPNTKHFCLITLSTGILKSEGKIAV